TPFSILDPPSSILDLIPWMDPNLQSGVIDTTMPTTTNKQRLLTQIFAHLPKAAKGGPDSHARPPEGLPVLEQFVYAVCREGTTREQGDRAFLNLRERFFDWNEVRVSSVRELAEAFDGLPEPEARAQR